MRPEQLHARATSQDNGQWTCVVTNARQTHVANVFVTVIGELLCTSMYALVLQ